MNFLNIIVFMVMIGTYKLSKDLDSQGRSNLATATYWFYILCMHNRLCHVFSFFGFDENDYGISTQVTETKQTVYISIVIWFASFISGLHF